MSNLLDAYQSHQNINNPSPLYKHTYTINTEGKVKPLEDKGKLLPSRIFGSPIEYVKDIKKDIVNIGRAANGQANDHELGRINDIALKLGSLAIASYLFVKNPLKLSKSMEFVGMGTFLGSMALWPKIALQAPIKARTGVDIHQKYIDSEGRKKMLFLDPQYDLTDLYSREDLDRMGRKLKVSKNLPDRDNFIKQRAKKTAVQANTLWMLSAGFASPVMSALACNALETPINEALEKSALKTTEKALKQGKPAGIINTWINKFRMASKEKALMKFLEQNAENEVTDVMLGRIANEFLPNANSFDFANTVKSSLKEITKNAQKTLPVDFESVSNILKDLVPQNFISSLSDKEKNYIVKLIAEGNSKKASDRLVALLTDAEDLNRTQSQQILKEIKHKLSEEFKPQKVTLGKISNKIKSLNELLKDFSSDKKLVDDYISARVGDKSGTYIANHWGRACKKLFKALKFSEKDLMELQNGNMQVFFEKLKALSESKDQNTVDSLLKDLLNLMDDYEAKTGTDFLDTVKKGMRKAGRNTFENIKDDDFKTLSDKIFNNRASQIIKKFCEDKKIDNSIINNLLKEFETKVDADDIQGALKLLEETPLIKDQENKFGKEIINEIKQALNASKSGTVENTVTLMAAERALGAKASLYRLIQTLDVLNPANKSKLDDKIRVAFKNIKNSEADTETVNRLSEIIQKILMEATPTDYVEKFTTSNFNITLDEYRIISNVLFDKADDVILLTKPQGGKEALKGFNQYLSELKTKVWDWTNYMTPELKKRVTEDNAATNGMNAVERSNLIGKTVKDYMKETAEKMYNSRKWLKTFGIAMAVILGVTLVAGLFVGRKSKIEKELEENKQNG